MLQPRLEALFTDLSQADLRWCLLRLPSGTGRAAGDVDLLVDESQIAQLTQTLERQGFTRLPGWAPGFHFLDFDLPTGQWLWLHVVTRMAFGHARPFDTGTAAGCLDHRQQVEGVSRLADGDAFWELLLHCLVDKGCIPGHHKPTLQRFALAADAPSALRESIIAAIRDGALPGRIAALAKDGCWAELEAMAPSLAAALERKYRPGLWQWLAQWSHQKILGLRNFSRTRGRSVALLGPDGAGKSTLLVALQEEFIFPVRPVYMGLTGGLLRYMNKLWLPFLVIPGRLLVFWARYARAQYHRLRGRLVVFDRYTYDYAVPTPYPLSRIERLYRWIDGHCLPGPDLVLILDAPGEVMFQRKGEYNPEMLEDWRRHFLALHDRLPKSQIVDTTRPAGVVCADVIHHIWQGYAQCWRDA